MTKKIVGYEDVRNAKLIRRVINAWVNAGPAPWYHRLIKQQVYQKWPTLAVAVEQLCREYREPNIVYCLYFSIVRHSRPSIEHPAYLYFESLDDAAQASVTLIANEKRSKTFYVIRSGIQVTHQGTYKEALNGK